MEQSFLKPNSLSKEEKYQSFIEDYASLIEDVDCQTSVLANTSAALREAFGFFWVGFYMIENESLWLGPFQGNVACYSIKKGRGVCGTAWLKACTIVVPDVDNFPGHIACSSLSRSEIVVPIMDNGVVKGVLDIDSTELGTFDEIDRIYLERIVDILSKEIYG